MPSEWSGERHSVCLNRASLRSDWARPHHRTPALPGLCGLPVPPHCGLCAHPPSAKPRTLLDCGHAHHLIHGLQCSQHCVLALRSTAVLHGGLLADLSLLVQFATLSCDIRPVLLFYLSTSALNKLFIAFVSGIIMLFPEGRLVITYKVNVYLKYFQQWESLLKVLNTVFDASILSVITWWCDSAQWACQLPICGLSVTINGHWYSCTFGVRHGHGHISQIKYLILSFLFISF